MLPVSPLSHAIAFGLLGWLFIQMRQVDPQPGSPTALLVAAVLAAWALATTWIAAQGLYLAHNDRLAIVAGIVAPYLLLGALGLSPRVRALALRFVRETPPARLARVHVLRILALGTIWKGWLGLMPAHFILPVAVPDLIVGALALVVAQRLERDSAHARRDFAVWNVAGIAVLLLAVPLMQLSQPGPLHVVTSGPRTDEVLGFPMSIIPTLVAPLLILLHVLTLFALRAQAASTPPSEPLPSPPAG